MRHLLFSAFFLFCLTGYSQERGEPAAGPTGQETAPAVERTRTLTFAQMGQPNGVRLSGINRFVDLNSGIRLDELVTRASLSLRVLYPQGMRHDQSFVRVYVNNQLSGLSQLSVARAGVPHTVEIELDPLLFSDFATIRVEYDGTYDSECVDPGNPTLRFDIRPESTLTIGSTPLNLVNDLALLPAPFFDPRDNRKLRLPLVLPVEQTEASMKAAGILASWMGAQAFYRQAEFELLETASPTRHTIILTKGKKMPEGMSEADIEGPSLMIVSAKENPWIKHLYVMGRSDEELLQAVYGLVIEGQVLSGQKALVKKSRPGRPAQALRRAALCAHQPACALCRAD